MIVGDVMDDATWAGIEADSVHCCLTSPPYWGLRTYGVEGQIGLEKDFREYIAKIVQVCRQVRRVLREDAVFFLNVGDSYASGKGKCRNPGGGEKSYVQEKERFPLDRGNKSGLDDMGLKPKDMCLIPQRLAIALQEDGWWVRSMMPWCKRNSMPESCTDRPASALEYVLMLVKSARYFFDMEAVRRDSLDTAGVISIDASGAKRYRKPWKDNKGRDQKRDLASWASRYGSTTSPGGRNFRNADFFFESIEKPHGLIFVGDEPVGIDRTTQGYKGAHYAVFPIKFAETLLKAGTSAKGCCPECGKPWARVVKKDRKATRPGKDTKVTGDSMTDGNRDPERHVTDTQTLGWRPQCSCYVRRWNAAIKEELPYMTRAKGRKLLQQNMADSWLSRAKKHADRWVVPKRHGEFDTEPCLCFDPFMGAGTVGVVAQRLGLRWVGIELNPKYAKDAERRIRAEAPLLRENDR